MTKTQDIHDVTACLRQLQLSPAGCSASEIAAAAGLSLERCSSLLERLEQASLVEPSQAEASPRFRLADNVTALHVLRAVWAPITSTIHILFEAAAHSARVVERCLRNERMQG